MHQRQTEESARAGASRPRRLRSLAAIAAIGAAALLTSAAPAQGPGPPNRNYFPGEVFTVLGRMGGPDAPFEHGTAAMHDGYLVIPFADNTENGGFAFYDISDPYEPTIVNTVFRADTREGHSMGFSYGYPGLYAVTQGSFGVHFWDWTDVTDPLLLADMQLPGIEASDYANGAWWLFWQAPYVYVSGSSRGLYIIDASDPANPVLVRRVPNNQTGGFRAGAVFAVGNLLVLTMNDDSGIATLDISDPVNPVLLDTDDTIRQYSVMVNANRIIAAGKDGDAGLHLLDITDPNAITYETGLGLPDKGGYLVRQDEFAHIGDSAAGYYKIDISVTPPVIEGSGDIPEPNADLDFVTVIGNLAVVSDDHDNGSALMPHRAARDTTGPVVNMVNPPADATNQAVTSRVGLTFSDLVDLRSVDTSTFVVQTLDGEAIPGYFSGQTGIVNFAPFEPFEPDTTYRVRVPAGGITDSVGNPTTEAFVSHFSTGSEVVVVHCTDVVHEPHTLVDAEVTFSIACEEPHLWYSWDFGDGTPPTPFRPNRTTEMHTYTGPGHFTVVLSASDGISTGIVLTTQTVVYPATAVPPARSSSVAIDDASDRLWVVNPDADTIAAIDTAELCVTMEISVDREPTTLALAPDNTAWVVNQDDATISVIALADGTTVETIALPRGSRPYGIALEPAGAHVYVTLEATGILLRIDRATRTVVDSVSVGPRPRGIAVSYDGSRVFVGRFVSPADHGEVTVIDTKTMSVDTTFELALDAGPDTESSGRGVPNYLLSLTISPDGRRLWIPSKKDNTVRGEYRTGEPLTFESTVRAIVSQVDLLEGVERLDDRIDLDNRALPSAVTFNARGDYAFVATLGSNTVDVVDGYSGRLVTSIEDVGLAPIGLALSADETRLFIHNYMSRSVTVRDVTSLGGDNEFPLLAVIDTVGEELLAPGVLLGKQIFYNAADDRMSRDNYLSCAVCHLDGGSDQRTWDFTDRGEGFRNTTVLRGRGAMDHGPVHWSANFDEIQDFEHDIRGPFEGSGFMSDGEFHSGTRDEPLGDPKTGISVELDALAAYSASLTSVPRSPYRNGDGTMTADALLGADLFHRPDVGCAECHTTSQLTDSSLCLDPFLLHDVGTITPASGGRLGGPLVGIDTPTLHGVSLSAPYLHDGSAATLIDVLTTANPDDAHGMTTHLDPGDIDLIVAYLRELENEQSDPCPADIDGSCARDFGDILLILAQWGPCPEECVADINGDGFVGMADTLAVLSGWGACP